MHHIERFWAEALSDFPHFSGTFKQFCEARGLPLSSAYRWKRILGMSKPSGIPSAPDTFLTSSRAAPCRPLFAPVMVLPLPEETCGGTLPDSGVRIKLGAATIMLDAGFDADTLRRVLSIAGEG